MNKNIYIFWTGYNKISQNRLNNIEQLKKQTGLNIIFITPNNLDEYILKTEPLHESYQYLSEVHKADYLRTYFMNFYGGGYSDIKKTRGNWIESFKLLYDSDKYINGYPELKPSDIAYKPLRKKWNKLIGNCAYICKKETSLTKEWYNEMIKLLDSKLDKLRLYPASHSRDKAETSNGKYPIEWNEMLGRIFHKICYKYRHKILKTLPRPICSNYK